MIVLSTKQTQHCLTNTITLLYKKNREIIYLHDKSYGK